MLLCPNILCYDWSMDSISRIESWWDMRNVETLAFSVIMVWLCCYGKMSAAQGKTSIWQCICLGQMVFNSFCLEYSRDGGCERELFVTCAHKELSRQWIDMYFYVMKTHLHVKSNFV